MKKFDDEKIILANLQGFGLRIFNSFTYSVMLYACHTYFVKSSL